MAHVLFVIMTKWLQEKLEKCTQAHGRNARG